MKRLLMIAWLGWMPLLIGAQVTISVQLPPAGLVQKEQLWNLALVNNKTETIDISLLLNLQDAITGQVVLSAATGNLLLGKGVKTLNAQEIQPIQYNYYTNDFMGSYLPMGSYIACYRVNKNRGEGPEPIGEECVRININPLSPPLLNVPADRAVVQGAYPQFSWLPPAPLNMFSNLSYDLTIAEILEGQSPGEAVLYNIPVYARTNLKAAFETYPSSYTKLDTGKHYAWQVTANNGMALLAKTEVWTFTISQPANTSVAASSASYIVAGSDRSGGVHFINGEDLYVKYYSYDKEHTTVLRVFASDGRLVQEHKQPIIYGDNFLHLRLKSLSKGQVYRFVIADQQKNSYSVSFGVK